MNPIRSGSDEVAMAQASQIIRDMLNVGNGVQTNTKDLTDASYRSVMLSEDVPSGTASAYGSLGEKTDYQEIAFLRVEDDEQTFKINGQEVTIRTNLQPHTSSSNRVKIKNVADFAWEQKYHTGHLVAAHVSGMYVAYSLILHHSGFGAVRVTHLKTDKRQLIKGLKGQVKDLAFAHSLNSVILACVDEYGLLLVHEITQGDNGLQCNLLLHMDRSDVCSSDHHLVFWCSYIPEDENDDLDEETEDNSRLLAVTHNKETEIFNVSFLSKNYGPGPNFAKDIPSGLMLINEHAQPITAAVFSPDGTALATASLDGEVKFFEVHLQEKTTLPRCLHQWKPHGGRPISCLFFLDNHKSPKPDVQFWKFALTGTDYNQELKLWSCESWDCLQTLEFKTTSSNEVLSPCMKVELDYSAGYLVLSDISNRVVYVLQIYQDVSQGEARVCSIAQFLLTQSVLSLAIVDAVRCRIKPLTGEVVESHDKNDIERNGESECKEMEDKSKGVFIKIWWINAKSLQEGHIAYHPPVTLAQHLDETMSINSQDSIVFQDQLSDLSQDLVGDSDSISKPFFDVDLPFRRDNSSTPVLNNNKNISGHSPAVSSSFNNSFRSNSSGTIVGEVLLTPDDFTSPSQPRSTLTVSPGCTSVVTLTPKPAESAIDNIEYKTQPLSKPTTASELALLSFPPESDPPLATSEGGSMLPPVRRKSSQVSSTSSLSQEVADILAPLKTDEMGPDGRSSNSPKLVSPPSVSSSSFLPGSTNHLNSNMVEDRKTSPLSSWPPAPDIKGYKMTSSDLPVETSNKGPINYVNLSSVNSNSVPVKYTTDNEMKAMLQKMQETLNSLKEKQTFLESMFSNQGKDVHSKVQTELYKNERFQAQVQQEQTKRLDKMEAALFAQLDKASSQQAILTQKKLENFITKQWECEHKLLERQMTEVPQAATLVATSKMAENVHNVVKSTIVPEVSRFLENFRQQIQQEQNTRLAASEAALKESINGLVRNKMFVDSLASSVAVSLQPQVQQVCRDVLKKNLLPAVDKTCQNLFLQLNEAFKTGTRDYLSQAETFLESSNAKQNQCQLVTLQKELKEQSSAIASSQQQHLHQIRDNVDKAIGASLQSFNEHLMQRLQTLMSEEIHGALEAASQKGLFAVPVPSPVAESRAVTPAPKMIDPKIMKKQILTLLQVEHYNEAFQMALRAADISLVNMTIEQVPPTKLFGDSSCATLKLPVLLSLLHQLGSSMDNNTELKIQYLNLALMSMDTSDVSCRNNQYQVLTSLREKLLQLYKQTPPSDLNRRIKMLAMCVEGLLRSLED